MAALGQSISVIDKSGKVVSTSKQLFGVFSHAKNAYRERKAQIKSERNAKIAEKEALKAIQTYNIDDAQSTTSSRRHRGPRSHHSGRSHHRRHPRSQYEQDLHSAASASESFYAPPQVVRRHTHHDLPTRELQHRPTTSRSKSDAHVDMDLAYGDFHPSSLEANKSPPPQDISDPELNGLVTRAELLLEEAHCAHHTATETIAHLQKNPNAMAAVALTLAEISNLAAKMAPSALTALKTATPAVWALLASPQFLIAAGVGLGVTVVMFGGYKIIKRIQSNNAENAANAANAEKSELPQELIDLDQECLSSVEMWRRGVADAEAESVATSVEGEFITPTAAAMSRLDLNSTRGPSRSRHPDDGSVASSRRSRRSRTHHSSRSHHSSRAPSAIDAKSESRARSRAPESVAPSRAGSKVSSKPPPSKADSRSSDKGKKKSKEKKGPSRLRQMFTAS